MNDDLVVLTPDEIELLGVALENADEWEYLLVAPEEHHAETAGN